MAKANYSNCKWCGKKFNTSKESGLGFFDSMDYCSVRCKQQAKKQNPDGYKKIKSKKKWLLIFVVACFSYAIIMDKCSKDKGKTDTLPAEKKTTISPIEETKEENISTEIITVVKDETESDAMFDNYADLDIDEKINEIETDQFDDIQNEIDFVNDPKIIGNE